jgi:predicted nucleic acid-binding protein
VTIVVDASVAIAWCFDDETSPAADAALERLTTEPAVAPAHWPLEVANALRSAERSGRLSPADLVRVTRLLTALPVEVLPMELPAALFGVFDLAREHQLSVYDAAYLDMAFVRDLPLATIDDRLREACVRVGIHVVA